MPAHHVEPAHGGQEAGLGLLGADAGLDGVARQAQFVLPQRQRLARRHAQLPFDEVQPVTASVTGCSTCSRVFISMKKKSRTAPLRVLLDDELHRTRAHIAHGPRRRHGCRRAMRVRSSALRPARRFLQHLLVPALHRAVTLEEVDDLACRSATPWISMLPGLLHIALDQHGRIAKAAQGLSLAGQLGGKVLGLRHHAQARPPPPALALMSTG